MSLRSLETSYPAGADRHAHEGAVQTLCHQFEDIEQQNECYIVGMWSFLVTEVMFFGALFLAYTVYRVLYFPVYLDAHRFLSIFWGGLNTFVLLTSSLAMALGVHAAQMGRHNVLRRWLVVVVLCSCIFLGVKYIEYSSKFREHLFPGAGFDYAEAKRMWAEENPGRSAHEGTGAGAEVEAAVGAPVAAFDAHPKVGFNTSIVDLKDTGIQAAVETPENQRARELGRKAQLFFCLYFCMTGLHAIHIIIGILLMSILWYLAKINHPYIQDYIPTEMVGFYWHFVDIVWIFLFPLMYLIS